MQIIDLGSNTVRLGIYKKGNGKFVKISDRVVNAQIINYINNAIISDEGINKIIESINYLTENNTEDVVVLATASLRKINNRKIVIERVYNATNIRIQVLSGIDEAEYTLNGIKLSVKKDRFSILDIGGGSTEIVNYNKGDVNRYSLQEGSLSIKSYLANINFDKTTLYDGDGLKNATEIVKNILNEDISKIGFSLSEPLYISGGTAETMFYFNNYLTNKEISLNFGDIMTYKNVEYIEKYLLSNKNESIKIINMIDEKRVETIQTGIIIMKIFMEYYHINNVYISTSGVREGYLSGNLSI